MARPVSTTAPDRAAAWSIPISQKPMAAGDRSSDNPQASLRGVMNSFYWKPPFKPAWEEDLLTSLMSEKVGPDKYPGDFVASANWPGVGPGVWGPINAVAPKYVGDSVKRFIEIVAQAANPVGARAGMIKSSRILRSSISAIWASSASCPAGPATMSSRPSR